MTQEHSTKIDLTRVEDDRPLWDVVLGCYGYPALLLAHKLKVFPLLADEPLTLPEICEKLNIKSRAAEALLTSAAALGFLSFRNERYGLTPLSEHYLLETSPSYFGYFWDLMIDNDQIHSFASLKRAILTDMPQVYGGPGLYQPHEDQVELVRRFTRAMYSFSITSAFHWPKVMDLSTYRAMLDIGGGSGAHSIGAVSMLPDLKATIFDFPLVCEIAREYISQHDLQHRIRICEGDMWSDPLPSADLHFYSTVYNDWPPEKCNFLTAKSFNSLQSGGRIIVHGMLYNDEKTAPFSAAAFSMLMMGWTEGRSYSARELSTMMSDAGFMEIETHPAFGYYSLVTGVKP